MAAQQANLYNLAVRTSLSTAGFDKGVGNMNKSLDKMERRFKRSSAVIKNFARGMAGAFTVRALTQFVKGTLEAADRIDKLSQVAGLSAENFQRFEHAASIAGVSADTFAKATATLSRRIGNAREEVGPLHSALSKLNPALLQSLKTAGSNREALLLMADAMKGAKDQAAQGALSMAAFGGSADQMTIALGNGREEFVRIGQQIQVFSNENTKAAAEFQDSRTNVHSGAAVIALVSIDHFPVGVDQLVE